ncbi:MAG: hypothetical protein K940chlam8_00122 [Chlamydiae bacterium]|nr:hypothetical protein [Chlamydiota bacterium]
MSSSSPGLGTRIIDGLARGGARAFGAGDYYQEYVHSTAPFVGDPTSLIHGGIQALDLGELFTFLMNDPSVTQEKFEQELAERISTFGLDQTALDEATPENVEALRAQLAKAQQDLRYYVRTIKDPGQRSYLDKALMVDEQLMQSLKEKHEQSVSVLEKQLEVAKVRGLAKAFVPNEPLARGLYNEFAFSDLMQSPSMTQNEFNRMVGAKIAAIGLDEEGLRQASDMDSETLQAQLKTLQARLETLQAQLKKDQEYLEYIEGAIKDPGKKGWSDWSWRTDMPAQEKVYSEKIRQLEKEISACQQGMRGLEDVMKKQPEVMRILQLAKTFVLNKPLTRELYDEFVTSTPKYHSIEEVLLDTGETAQGRALREVIQRMLPKLNHGLSWLFRQENFDVTMALLMDKLGDFFDLLNDPTIVEKGHQLAAKQRELNQLRSLVEPTSTFRDKYLPEYRQLEEEMNRLKQEYHDLVKAKMGIDADPKDFKRYRERVAKNAADNLADILVLKGGKDRALFVKVFYDLFFWISKKLITLVARSGVKGMLSDESLEADKEGLKGVAQSMSGLLESPYLGWAGISPDHLNFLIEENLQYMIPYLFDHAISDLARYKRGETYIPDRATKLKQSFSHLGDSAVKFLEKHVLDHGSLTSHAVLGGLGAQAKENILQKTSNTLALIDAKQLSRALAARCKSFFVPHDKYAEVLARVPIKSAEEERAQMLRYLEEKKKREEAASQSFFTKMNLVLLHRV